MDGMPVVHVLGLATHVLGPAARVLGQAAHVLKALLVILIGIELRTSDLSSRVGNNLICTNRVQSPTEVDEKSAPQSKDQALGLCLNPSRD